ncbi:MAG: hypothetical protein KatS3mg118_2709 [Paracoccaceae bacterium]|nr:MAG: hypothetical protein KatS3mg118_2709 [Paracoccaceae bacterium]
MTVKPIRPAEGPRASGAQAGRRWLQALALTGAAGFWLLLQGLALTRTGGAMEYPLDDVYIHLAMAVEIARGGYGVNPGQPASAASSILYPLLLTPFAGSEAQRWLPLMWNLAALVANALLWGAILARAGLGAGRAATLGAVLALLGPLALNMAGVAFLGMEHGLHLTATLAVVLGLQRFVAERRSAGFWRRGSWPGRCCASRGWRYRALPQRCCCWAGVPGGDRPGDPGAGAGGGLRGLPARAGAGSGAEFGAGQVRCRPGRCAGADAAQAPALFMANLRRPEGAALGILSAGLLLAGLTGAARGRARLLALAGGVAGLAHLILGQIGWLHRYEIYALTFCAGVAIALAGRFLAGTGAGAALGRALAVLALAAGVVRYAGAMAVEGPLAARAIFLQQRQMARLVTEHLRGPVAVNDLGWVAWASDWPVLDLWGLASARALAVRLSDPPAGWAGPLVRDAGARW